MKMSTTVKAAFISAIILAIATVAGALMPGGNWRTANATLPIGAGMTFAVGDFAGVIVDFLIVSVVVFFIAKYAGKAMEKSEEGMKEGVKEGSKSE